MATMLKKLPGHFENEAAAENAVQFALALILADVEVEVSSILEAGQRWMLMRCTNGQEEAFKRLCEQYHPSDMVDSSEVL